MNTLKTKWHNQLQVGLFLGIPNAYTAEIVATVGFEFLLIDGEHGPNTMSTVLAQMQTLAAYPSSVVLRIPDHDPIKLKQYLDIGVENFLIPMVETATQAEQLVKATRYPPEGFRGVGTAMARAAKWNGIENYFATANQNIGILLQVESMAGVENLTEILATEGVDGIFIGPADLAASMGHLGQPQHPEVQEVIANALKAIKTSGKVAGIFASNPDAALKYQELGVSFLVVGVDTLLLRQSAVQLLKQFRPTASVQTGFTY